MRFLRKNTAVIITVGPFFDKTDGVTIETGLTITNERITLVADTDDGNAPTNILDNVTGATSGTDNDLNYITNNDAGMMQLELSAANTNRNGRLLLSITDAANHVPVFHEFMILDGAVYDSLILGTDKLAVDAQEISSDATAADNAELMFDGTGYAGGTTKLGVDVVAISGDATAANNEESFFDGTGYAGTNNVIPTVTTVNGLAAGVITAAAIATDAIDADAIAADAVTEIQNGLALAADLSTDAEIADAVWDEALSGHTTAGTGGKVLSDAATAAALDTIDDFLDTEVAAILEDTGTTIPAQITALNNLSAAQVNAEVVDVLRTDTLPDSYAADGAQPTFAQAVLAVHQFLMEKAVSGTTVTVNKPDGSTAVMTFTLDDGTSPTSITRAT